MNGKKQIVVPQNRFNYSISYDKLKKKKIVGKLYKHIT